MSMGVVLIAYDGTEFGWDSTIKVGYGRADRWVHPNQLPSMHMENSREVLRKAVKLMSYKLGEIREGNLITVAEFPWASNAEKVWRDFLKALKRMEAKG